MNTLTLLNDAKYFDEGNSKFAELRSLLDSKHTKEKLEAMKRLMAMITIGRDVSSFFPDVVKNIVVESQEVKKLVYMYLIHYSEQNQELALLSINSFQKDLASHSQRVRANAMKAMSSIRIPVAIPLVILALKTAVKDHSSYVRRAAAAAIPKVWSVDPDQGELLIELIVELLTNNEPLVLGSAIFAFLSVCPDRHDLLHPHFRKICHLLADFDEWGQIITLDLLLRYGRTQFLDPITASSQKGRVKKFESEEEEKDQKESGKETNNNASSSSSSSLVDELSIFNTPAVGDKKSSKKDKKSQDKSSKNTKTKKKSDNFYSDEDSDSAGSASSSKSSTDDDRSDKSDSDSDSDSSNKKRRSSKRPNPPALTTTSSSAASSSDPFRIGAPSSLLDDTDLDEDHRLLLKQASQLLQSSNTGVIVGVTSLMWSLAPKEDLSKIVRPLVRLSRNKRNIQYVVLTTIATMASSHPELFRPYLKDFFITPFEPRYVKEIKMDILVCITSEGSIGSILKEFLSYTSDSDKVFVMKSIESLGKIAQGLPRIATRVIRGLMNMVEKNANEEVTSICIVTIRQLLQSNPSSKHLKGSLLLRLSKLLETITLPEARISIIWMVGEYREKFSKVVPDVLRKLLRNFISEEEHVKIQILNLALKLFLSNQKQTANLFKYTMDLCKYDANIDLRDRARMMRALFFKKKVTSSSEAPTTKEVGSEVKDHFKSNLLVSKPSPRLILPFEGRNKWILGTLTHTLNQTGGVLGYKDLPEFPKIQPDTNTRKPKTVSSNTESEARLKEMKSQRQSNKSRRSRRGSGSDSDGSSRSRSSRGSSSSSRRSSRSSRGSSSSSRSSRRGRSRSDSESEFSSFGSESERSSSRSSSRSRSSRRRGGRSSESDSSRSRSRSPRRHDSDSDDDDRRRRNNKRSSRHRRSRSRSTSPIVSSSSPAIGGANSSSNNNYSLDFLDLKGLDLSSGALADPNLESTGFGAFGEAHITFSAAAASSQRDTKNLVDDDLLGSFAPTVKSSTAKAAAAAEDDILARAFGGK